MCSKEDLIFLSASAAIGYLMTEHSSNVLHAASLVGHHILRRKALQGAEPPIFSCLQ
jgi:hypothetical protein